MKIFVVENNNSEEVRSWYFLPDSCLTNAGKPFFIPEIFKDMSAYPLLAFKITRLGKTISKRFADRYFTGVAAGFHFIATQYAQELNAMQLSPDRARGFDRSLFLTDFIEKEKFLSGSPIKVYRNGIDILDLHPDLSNEAIGHVIEAVSKENTLKMGDIIIPLLYPGFTVSIDDEIELRKEDKTLLRIEIK
ncbi:MAG: hypothetical protein K2J48_04805 [Muribaculaceae bacterium]|nr:hypothetical protein [Muribaculaceae bacterium]